jgi:hypothetical protein
MEKSPTLFTYLHSTPGRMRIRVPARRGDDRFSREIETLLRHQPGIEQVSANTLTGSILILFDPVTTDDRQILAELARVGLVGDLITPAPAPLTVSGVTAQIGAAIGKELVKAVLAQAMGKSPVGLLLSLL